MRAQRGSKEADTAAQQDGSQAKPTSGPSLFRSNGDSHDL
jgi:hypothetical protein